MCRLQVHTLLLLLSFCAICSSVEQQVIKCSIYNSTCQQNYYQTIAKTDAKHGMPQIGVPVIDPYKILTVSTSVLGLAYLTLTNGAAEGISNCLLISYETNMKKFYKSVEIVCDLITIKGHYKLSPSSFAQKLPGDKLHGDGNGTFYISHWYFKFNYPFKIVRHDDGQIYLRAFFDQSVYEAAVLGKVSFEADNIMFGDRDITEPTICFLNKNWRIFWSLIEDFVNDMSAKYYYEVYDLFFEQIPANQYLTDDLAAFVDD